MNMSNRADVHNLENIAPGEATSKLGNVPNEQAYPAAALIQSLATSASGDGFTAPRPKVVPCSGHSKPSAPLTPSNFNLTITPTKRLCNVEPLTPTSNLKVLVAASSTHGQSVQPESVDCLTPTKTLQHSEPLTPTANLKMLISAASPEIRNLVSKKKDLLSLNDLSSEDDNEDLFEPDRKKSKKEYLCRKDKSLGLLCQKFISRFDEYPPHNAHIDVCLDELAKDLEVERRRIYDIVNVLESVEMMSRRAKNRYLWHGKTRLVDTLVKLKQLADEEGIQQQLNIVREYELSKISDEQDDQSSSSSRDGKKSPSNMNLKQYMELFGNQMKKEKSLGIMSQKFLMLFLTSTKTVNLDIAAKILIGDPTMESSNNNAKFKTKIRRLYDIANILTSLSLIRKVHVTEVRGRKPAFQYVGPSIDRPTVCGAAASKAEAILPERSRTVEPREQQACSAKRSLIRHASFDTICKVAETERTRLISSQPSSPVKDDDDGSSSGKPRQYVMIQGAGPKMQVITTSQAPTFMASSSNLQRVTLIPVSTPAMTSTASHIVFRAQVLDEPLTAHFSPLSTAMLAGDNVNPASSRQHGNVKENNARSGHSCEDTLAFTDEPQPYSAAARLAFESSPATTRVDDDFKVFKPLRMLASNVAGGGQTVSSDSQGITCTPVQRRNRCIMSSLLNPARNLYKTADFLTEPSCLGMASRSISEFALSAPSISEVPLTTISPLRPVASFCSPAAGVEACTALKTPVNEHAGSRPTMYTTPGFVPFASAATPTAFRPVQKSPSVIAIGYTETVRRLKLK